MEHLKLFENFIDSKILDIEDYLLELTEDGLLERLHDFMVVNDDTSLHPVSPRIVSLYRINIPDNINNIDDIEKVSILYKRLKGCLSRCGVEFKILNNNNLVIYIEPSEGIKKLFGDLLNTYGNGFTYDKIDDVKLDVNFGKIHDDMTIEISVNGYDSVDVRLISEFKDIQKSIIDKFTKEYNLKFIEISDMTFVKKLFRFTS